MPEVQVLAPSASFVILREGHSQNLSYSGLESALTDPKVSLRLFAKPQIPRIFIGPLSDALSCQPDLTQIFL